MNEKEEAAAKLQMLLEDFGPVRNDPDASHIVRLAINALTDCKGTGESKQEVPKSCMHGIPNPANCIVCGKQEPKA